jgi:hypothetical protein
VGQASAELGLSGWSVLLQVPRWQCDLEHVLCGQQQVQQELQLQGLGLSQIGTAAATATAGQAAAAAAAAGRLQCKGSTGCSGNSCRTSGAVQVQASLQQQGLLVLELGARPQADVLA